MPVLNRSKMGQFVSETLRSRVAPGFLSQLQHHLPGGVGSDVATPAEAHGRFCGAAGCTSQWMKPWKAQRRPVFAGEWGCSASCLEKMVSLALLRLLGQEGESTPDLPHRHRVPLGLVLLAQGWITHPQLQAALAAQRDTGEGRVGDWLTRQCSLPEERIARGLGVQWNCPVLTLQGFSPRSMALVMPKRFVAQLGLIPVRLAGSSILYMAFHERIRPAEALALGQMCGLKVESGLLTTTNLEAAKERLLSEASVPVSIHSVTDADELSDAVVKLLQQRQPIASRIVRIRDYYWLRMWRGESAIPAKGQLQASVEDTEDHIFTAKFRQH